MHDPEKWKIEQERVEALQEEKKVLPFGYDLLYNSLEAIRECFMAQNTGLAGVVLGR